MRRPVRQPTIHLGTAASSACHWLCQHRSSFPFSTAPSPQHVCPHMMYPSNWRAAMTLARGVRILARWLRLRICRTASRLVRYCVAVGAHLGVDGAAEAASGHEVYEPSGAEAHFRRGNSNAQSRPLCQHPRMLAALLARVVAHMHAIPPPPRRLIVAAVSVAPALLRDDKCLDGRILRWGW